MRGFVKSVMLMALISFAVPSGAETLIPEKHAIVLPDSDLPGGDIASSFNTSLDACERACFSNSSCNAYTFNGRNGSCFLKDAPGEPGFFQGATSARVVKAAAGAQALAASRRAELSFFGDYEIDRVRALAAVIGHDHTSGNWTASEHLQSADESEASGDFVMATAFTGAALAIDDRAELWLEYSRRASMEAARKNDNAYWYRERAVHAAVNAYLRAEQPALRHSILVQMALALESNNDGRLTVQALRLAQKLQHRDDTAEYLETAAGKYGFRVEDHIVEADLARPRICARFTEALALSGVDYADFVQLPGLDLAVELPDERQLCVTGVSHGQNYKLTLREGLPAADGQSLVKDIALSFYVRDRNPGLRFQGRGYVLPLSGEVALPLESVNTEAADLTLYRVAERNLLRSDHDGYFGAPMDYYHERGFTSEIGEVIWQGSAKLQREVNKDIITRLPLTEALQGQGPGIYVLRAALPGVDPYDTAPAWQWFVVSDLGVTSMSGIDGLHVFLRSLTTAGAKEGVKVDLLSRANSVLASAVTDKEGYARFDSGLTRGTGTAAPAMLVMREGDQDISFLSLTDPEFDLSDRGVEGREPAPPVDVFLTTERGAYRAGERVYATALARDAQGDALEGLPLTAILTRPDGVEYSRSVVTDQGAGGYVFDLAVAPTAPRGMWSLALFADTEAGALAQKTFLVEDFLPERIDFTLKSPRETLSLTETQAQMGLEARYLFGAPASGLLIEGEIYLRAAKGLKAWPGYVFGRGDQLFDTRVERIDSFRTDDQGRSELTAFLPSVEAVDRPLEALWVLRVSEGSGRPVERRLTQPADLIAPVIGIKPAFDGVVAEKSEAEFSLIALDSAAALREMPVKWTLTRVETEWQWYQAYGSWNWEPVTYRVPVSEGEMTLGAAPQSLSLPVDWGSYELRVEEMGRDGAVTSTSFAAGWYAPAEVAQTPDLLELSLDRPDYKAGDKAQLRLVPRAAGTALITVVSNRLVSMQAVEVTEGENLISLDVTDAWGAGVYVAASVLRPMDGEAKRLPSRALGLAYARIDPGKRALATRIEAPAEADPRGRLDVAVRVEGLAAGEAAFVTLAAVDEGILNLTGYKAPDPQDHYFGQRKLGIGIRDIYGRLIDGMNGASGEVRSGGDAGAQARLQADPPTEELVAYFTGPLAVGEDGLARASFDLPAFNGTVRLMAVAWSKTGIGQAAQDVLVRDPVVVTASLPRFMAPGDESRLLLEITHASGPAGQMALGLKATGLSLGAAPAEVSLSELGSALVEVPVTAAEAGLAQVEVSLTTPDGKVLLKDLSLPVQSNDPEITRSSRLDLATGASFTFDKAVFEGLRPGSAKSVMAIGPIARLNAPGLLLGLDAYPYGCTEQLTSQALPLIYFDELARVMELQGAGDIKARIEASLAEILTRQGSGGGFGLWSAGSGDLWLDAYVTDFLSRARSQGYQVPDLAFRNALANLRNRVNYAPDFDEGTVDAGGDLAYTLMVLAREGAAAIGDLRYYADVKGDAFGSALAQAQLGAALAFYGDQLRADAMFAKAAAKLRALPDDQARQIWRADYGTQLRDTAAVLTLAAEAGSTAVDREALSASLAGREGRLSTQEATWTLMATNALLDPTGLSGISIDGAPASGALVRVLEDELSAPVVVKNDGPATQLIVTTYGIPSEPVSAGGNGYTLERSYFTLDGAPATPEGLASGERLVVVLTVKPWGEGAGRLILDDPLPAGFEIDNPNLINAGALAQLDWLDGLPGRDVSEETRHSEFRQERFIAQVDASGSESFRLSYIVRAISPGLYHHPAALVEDMYRPDFRAWTDAGSVRVLPR